MNTFIILIASAILSEAIWEILKNLIPDVNEKIYRYINQIGSLLIGILIAVTANINIFTLLDISANWYISGVILTGILISRGSNYIHDLIKKLRPGEE